MLYVFLKMDILSKSLAHFVHYLLRSSWEYSRQYPVSMQTCFKVIKDLNQPTLFIQVDQDSGFMKNFLEDLYNA